MTTTASICMSTFNKAAHLRRTLAAIATQQTDFGFEVIVTNDGSTDNTFDVLEEFNQQAKQNPQIHNRKFIETQNRDYRNPSVPRNMAYREARGDVVVAMSDDVIMSTGDCLQKLVNALKPGIFCIATVHNYDAEQKCLKDFRRGKTEYTGNNWKRPLFFLGSLWRKDLYAVGGCEEAFIAPGFDDDRFADAIMKGLGLKPVYLDNCVGYHQSHPRPRGLARVVRPSQLLYKKLTAKSERTGNWFSSGGAWPS